MYVNHSNTKQTKQQRRENHTNKQKCGITKQVARQARQGGRKVKGRGSSMFNTDIDARKNAIEQGKLEETKRHNKAQESYERPSKIMSGVGSLVKAINPFKVSGKFGNHPSWYLQDTSLAAQSTAISDQVPIGKNQEVIEMYKNNTVLTKFSSSEAVCAIYDYAPVISLYDGKVSNDIEELNAAIFDKAPNYISKALYTTIKASCRRNLPYSPSDVMRTMLVVMDIFCNIETMKRVYRVANTYRFTNQTIGAHLVSALGFQYDQVKTHLSDILFRINRLGKMLASVRIPKGQTLLDRWLLLAGSINKDRDCDRSRLFAFRKRIMYLNVQGETEGNIPRTLRAKTMENADGEYINRNPGVSPAWLGWDYDKVLSAIEAQIYSLLNNGDILSCLADINTAFESNGFWEFIPLNADEQQEFGYDEIMISQIRNAVVCGSPRSIFQEHSGYSLDATCFDVYDVGNGNILQGPGYEGYVYPVSFNTAIYNIQTEVDPINVILEGTTIPRIGIDTPVDNPDAGVLLTVSRLCPTMEQAWMKRDTTWEVVKVIKSHGSEILIGMEFSFVNNDATNQSYNFWYIDDNSSSWSTYDSVVQTAMRLQCYNAVPRFLVCDWHYSVVTDGAKLIVKIGTATGHTPFIMGDMTHVVYCDNSLIARWHFIAVASEFALPSAMKV